MPPHDPDRTREKILDAAAREFAAKGMAGARVDAIARRARANKRMIYHYFGSKRGLFEAIVARSTERNGETLARMPEDPSSILREWAQATGANLSWIRLLQWEALECGDSAIVGRDARRRNIRGALARLVEGRAKGAFDEGLDPAQLLLSLSALAVFPWAFPQVTRLMCGRGPGDRRFQRERARFLERLGALLSGGGRRAGGGRR